MNLKNINILLNEKKYQRAFIEYSFYALNNPFMADIIALNIKRARTKLERQLTEMAGQHCSIAHAPAGEQAGSLDIQMSPPWAFSDQALDSQGCAWWRLDYVIQEGDAGTSGRVGSLSIPVCKIDDKVVMLRSAFTESALGSLIFRSESGAGLEDFYQGVQPAGSVVVAFSLQRIEHDRLFSQLVSELIKSTGLEVPMALGKLKSQQTLDSVFGARSVPAYLEKLVAFGETPGNDAEQHYFDSAAVDLNDSVAIYLGQPTNASLALTTLIDAEQLVEHKWQLGDDVNFNIEGVKCLVNTRIVHGWIVDPRQAIQHIHLIHPNAPQGIELFQKAVKFDRPDVVTAFGNASTTSATHYGFAGVVTEQLLSANSGSVEIVVTLKCGKQYRESAIEQAIALDNNGLQQAIGILTGDEINSHCCERFFKPLFTTFTHLQPKVEQALNQIFGPAGPHAKPLLSVVIPLYGDTRFELTQIPQLAALRQTDWEIIFAVDEPRILSAVKDNVQRLAELYGLPVRVLAPDRNLGFSGINNFAVERAQGEYVLFLNSDCFITRAAPFLAALNWLRNTPGAGAAGFRLLFADNTVQHDGMSVERWKQQRDFYLNAHPRIGVPSELVPKRPSKDKAVMLTAACLMMSRQRFDEVGGFNRAYLRGDFEDSDLCLKILARGAKLGIVRQDGIYHLERQSIGAQDSGLRQKITLVNSYIYSQRWKTMLAKKMSPLEVIE